MATHTRPKHLLSPEVLARAALVGRDTDLTRHRGQGNGLRVHGISFALLSLGVLVALIVAIAVAGTTM